MLSSKKVIWKGTLQQVLICLRPPSLLGIALGWSNNFVGSESGQIQRVQLLQRLVSNRTKHTPPPPSYSIQCTLTQGGGGTVTIEKVRGKTGESTDHKARSKIPTGLNVYKKLAIPRI
jgi:hypothetical protein